MRRLMFVLASIGLIDALYLSYARLFGTEVACVITSGCTTVAESAYSVFLGVPLAYIGVTYYLIVLILAYMNRLQELLLVTFVGAVMSLYFIFIQVFVIGAYCMYCLLSAVISFILMGIAYVQYIRKNSTGIL